MSRSLKNIPLSVFRKFLESRGCKKIRTKGGHETWSCNKTRPIVIQSHIDPVPMFIVKNNLRTLELTNEDLFEFLDKN